VKPLPRNVVALGVVSGLNDVASEVTVRIIAPYLKNVVGAPIDRIGLVEGVAEATSTFVKLAAGVLSDKSAGRKPLTLAGYALSNLTKPLLYLATSWPFVLALRFLDRVGKGIRTAPRDALLADSVGAEDRGRAFGFHRSCDNAGSTLGIALVIAVLLIVQGTKAELTEGAFRVLVGLAVVPAVLVVLVVALFVREPERVVEPPKAVTAGGGRLSGLTLYYTALFVFSLAVISDNLLVVRATELGLALPWALALLAAGNVVAVVLGYTTGALSDRLGRRGFLGAGWAIFAVELAGFAFATTGYHLLGLFLLHGLFLGLTEGNAKALLTDLAPADARGRAFGIMNALAGAAALPASWAPALLWKARGAPTAFLALSGFAVLGLVLLAFVPSRRVEA
jgi:MFS family permease